MGRRLLLLSLGALVGCGTSGPPPPPPACSASTCAGCCDGSGLCRDGTELTACGRLGLTCATCASGQRCTAGLCQGAVVTGGGSAAGGEAGGSAGGSAGGTAGGDAGGAAGGFAGGSAGGDAGGQAMGGGMAGGTSGGSAGGAGGGAAGGAAGGTARSATRFASTFVRWSVPSAGNNTSYNALASAGSNQTLVWTTLDVSGDGVPDLVLPESPLTGNVWNTGSGPYWSVHLGGRGGFASNATSWPVPTNAAIPNGYNATSASQTLPPLQWLTTDVNADGVPDLVHTANPNSGGPYVSLIGMVNDGWLVRLGTMAGFATTATSFTVPRLSGLMGGIDRFSSDAMFRRWTVTTLNGDRVPDLVVTADPSTDLVWSQNGQAQWLVCPGGPAGFTGAATCTRISIPASGTTGGFRSAFATGWALTDLTGDGRADLVQTQSPGLGTPFQNLTLNRSYWRVWPNTSGTAGASLASTSVEWFVPNAAFNALAGATANTSWQVFDLTGDDVPELVQPADPTTNRPWLVGNGPAWRYYPQNAARTAFQATPLSFAIPAGPTVEGFRSVSGAQWATLDLTGDGLVDLVQFRDVTTGQAFVDLTGGYWRVYPGQP
ncbi:MAG: hypothetical protein SFW67_18320 [Myxococcaceae bacterium]|nr:hypothetical protein [Myxococcaceae bacterium]